jgi:hypothetical protein
MQRVCDSTLMNAQVSHCHAPLHALNSVSQLLQRAARADTDEAAVDEIGCALAPEDVLDGSGGTERVGVTRDDKEDPSGLSSDERRARTRGGIDDGGASASTTRAVGHGN